MVDVNHPRINASRRSAAAMRCRSARTFGNAAPPPARSAVTPCGQLGAQGIRQSREENSTQRGNVPFPTNVGACSRHARAETPAASRGGDPVFAGSHVFLVGFS